MIPTTTVTGMAIWRLEVYHALAVSIAEPASQLPLLHVPPYPVQHISYEMRGMCGGGEGRTAGRSIYEVDA